MRDRLGREATESLPTLGSSGETSPRWTRCEISRAQKYLIAFG